MIKKFSVSCQRIQWPLAVCLHTRNFNFRPYLMSHPWL
uniref:Uncharacterized protein n=1 Tax=Arundo donax TaxID=35708 RepID=A0A0A9FET7_ARUDO